MSGLVCTVVIFFIHVLFFKQKTAYEMRISDWSSDVCSSDLHLLRETRIGTPALRSATEIVDHDLRTLARHQQRRLAPDSASCASDNRDTPIKSSHILLPLVFGVESRLKV